MTHNHAVIWLDHHNAHIVSFNKETSEETTVRAKLHTPHLHDKSGSGHAHEDTAYFDEIAKAVEGVAEILVAGPGTEKVAFTKYLGKAHPKLAEHVCGVETVDHPSPGQLLAHARKFFVKADLYI